MGYRARLGRFPRSEYGRYVNLSHDEAVLLVEVDNASLYRPKEHVELYELGKYFEYGPSCSPFYMTFDVYEASECEFFVMGKRALANMIDDYRQHVLDYYMALKSGEDDVEHFVDRKIRTWGENCTKLNFPPYWLDEKDADGEIVRSWEFEYAIFNLVYIYRTFDWENDFLIYSAW